MTACNKSKLNTSSNQEQALQENMAIANILSILTGQSFDNAQAVTLEGKTFEPVYGDVLDDSNSNERSIRVQSSDYSEDYFRSLVGSASGLVKKTSDGLMINLSSRKFGKLTFHKADGGNNSGYVDVEVPCIPKLSRISYKTEEQWGDNAASFPWLSDYVPGNVFKDNDDDNYYLVVHEPDNSYPGVMVCMEAGIGTRFPLLP